MQYIEIENNVFFPANKIVGVIKNQDNDRELIIWLDGQFIQNVVLSNHEERNKSYDKITNILREL